MKNDPIATSGLAQTLKKITQNQAGGRHEQAIELCEDLIAGGSASAAVWYHCAFSHYMCGRLTPAIENLDIAMKSAPLDVRFHELYALLAYDFGELSKAVELLTLVISEEPQNFYCWNLLANALREGGRPEEAKAAAIRALDLEPDKPDAYFTSAEIAMALGRATVAALGYDEGLARLTVLDMHHAARRLEIAFEAEDGDFIESHVYHYLKLPFIEESFIRIVRIFALHLVFVRRNDEALCMLEAVSEGVPDIRTRLDATRAWILMSTERLDEAQSIYASRLETAPGDASARFQLALCQMARGQTAEGFKNYEARWNGSTTRTEKRDLPIPMWSGEPLEDRRILVWGEQGIGDQLRFATLLTHVPFEQRHLRIECTAKLAALFELAFPQAEIGARSSLSEEIDYTSYDFHVPMGSLPLIVGEKYFKQSPSVPWLPSDKEAESAYRLRFDAPGEKRLIGLCWRSGFLTRRRQLSYLTVSCLQELACDRDTRFVILQHDALESEVGALREFGLDVIWPTEVDQKDDLLETCKLIGACDIVVTVNCAVCDLAGSIGVPSIMIAPHGTWILFGRLESPWHPNSVYAPLDLANPKSAISEVRRFINGSLGSVSWKRRVRA